MPDEHQEFRTPGQLIDSLLRERGWTKRTLAIVMGMDEGSVTRLTADKQAVSAANAIALEEVFGVPAERFLDLQKSYDLAKARIVVRPDPARQTRAHLFGGLPIAEMIKRRWIEAEDVKDVRAVEGALAKFFGVPTPDQIEVLPHAAKKTQVTGDVTPAQLAWLYRVRAIAGEMLVPRYSPSALEKAVAALKPLRAHPEELRKVPRLLTEAGVRLLIVESLPAAKIDGVCFWLNDHSPVVALTTRHDRIDNIWFVCGTNWNTCFVATERSRRLSMLSWRARRPERAKGCRRRSAWPTRRPPSSASPKGCWTLSSLERRRSFLNAICWASPSLSACIPAWSRASFSTGRAATTGSGTT